MRYTLDYLRHLLSSHSTHGTHSPFVYDLADKAIYSGRIVQGITGSEKINTRYKNVLLRIFDHLDIRSITDTALLSAAVLSADEVDDCIQSAGLVVVDAIYRDKLSKANWKAAAALPEVTVSIDLFHFGLLLKRDGQAKEDFKLRYPFWIQ